MVKKYRITKKWPLGPDVGVEFETDCGTIFPVVDKYGLTMLNCPIEVRELAEYLEEVKEPEFFWCLDTAGYVVKYTTPTHIPDYLRFKTKEACEKFRDGLIATHGACTILGNGTTLSVHYLVNALNQRLTK